MKKCHFIGIGGIGMSGLARILLSKNIPVTGSDIAQNYVTEGLIKAGAVVHVGHSAKHISDDTTVIFSTDIKKDNPEYQAALSLKCQMLHRSDLLVELMKGQKTISIAGTHGKTTTTAMLTSVLIDAGVEPSYAIGGVMKQTQSNAGYGNGEYFIAEADESDGTFLKYDSYGAIITNIDLDHMNHFGTEANLIHSFGEFARKVHSKKHLFWCGDDARLVNLHLPGISYGVEKQCALRAFNISHHAWETIFDISYQDRVYEKVIVAALGHHNVLNALAVFGMALALNVPEKKIRHALSNFEGVNRRVEKKAEIDQILLLDDYAHHPTEIATTLAGIKKAVGPRRLVAVFQPHRYSRTKDCLGTYGNVFDAADELFVTDIFSAGEAQLPNVSHTNIMQEVQQQFTVPCTYVPRKELAHTLSKMLQPHDVIVSLGAGDITKLSGEITAEWKLHGHKKMTVGVIFGGCSVEHEISLLSTRNVLQGLDPDLYSVRYFAIDKRGFWVSGTEAKYQLDNQKAVQDSTKSEMMPAEVMQGLQQCDLFLPVLHGNFGEDGTIQGFFEILGKPYTGCDYRSSAIAMDKVLTKQLALDAGIPTSPFVAFTHMQWKRHQKQFLNKIAEKLTVFTLDDLINKVLLTLMSDAFFKLRHPLLHTPALRQELAALFYDPALLANQLPRTRGINNPPNRTIGPLKKKESRAQDAQWVVQAGTALNGVDNDNWHRLRFAGANDISEMIYGMNAMLSNVLVDLIQSLLPDAPLAEEIHVALNNTATIANSLPALNLAIHKIASGDSAGARAVYALLRAYLTPALIRATNNLIASTPLDPKLGGKHAKQGLPLDVLGRLTTAIQEQIAKIEAEKIQDLTRLRDEIADLEDTIKKLEKNPTASTVVANVVSIGRVRSGAFLNLSASDLTHADRKHLASREMTTNPASGGAVPVIAITPAHFDADVKGLAGNPLPAMTPIAPPSALQQAKLALAKAKAEIATLFKPLATRLLAMTTDNSNLVSNKNHPLHNVQILPEITRQSIWDTLLHKCVADAVATQYCRMRPNETHLEDQLRRTVNDDTISSLIIDFCKRTCVVVRDSTPDSLIRDFSKEKDPRVLANNLIESILKSLLDVDANSKSKGWSVIVHYLLKNNQKKITTFIADMFNLMGTSEHPLFKKQLWPALQTLAYPLVLKLVIHLTKKINEIDNKDNRIQITANIFNVLKEMFQAKKGEKPHTPLLNIQEVDGEKLTTYADVFAAPPEKEDDVKKKYFEQRAKILFKKIGFTQDDLPLDDWQKKDMFALLLQGGGLVLNLLMNMAFPGKTRDRIDGYMFHLGEINFLNQLKGKIAAARDDAAKAKDAGIPTPPTPPPEPASPRDNEHKHVVEHIGDILRGFMSKLPDPIARERFIIGLLMQQKAEYWGKLVTELCKKHSFKEGVFTLLKLLDPNFCTKDVDGNFIFKPETITAEKKAATALEAKELFTDVFSDTIIYSLATWFEAKGQGFDEFIDSICAAIDKKIDASVNIAKPVGTVIKIVFHWLAWAICWILFPFIWLAKTLIRWRVGVNSDLIHEEATDPARREFGYRFLDTMLGIEGKSLAEMEKDEPPLPKDVA